MINQLIEGSDERIEAQLAKEAAQAKIDRVPLARASRAVATRYPGTGTVTFDAPTPPQEANPLLVLAAVLTGERGFKVADKEAKKLREFITRDREACALVMQHTYDTVIAEYRKTPPPEGRPPRDVAMESALELRRAAKRARAEIPKEYAPLLLDLLARAEAAVRGVLEVEIQRYHDYSEAFGIAPSETPVVRALRKAMAWVEERRKGVEVYPGNASLEIAKVLCPNL
jgi:hypothetical protein